eukprot:Clim_evm86s215 gene=Clim_evmTU86s215
MSLFAGRDQIILYVISLILAFFHLCHGAPAVLSVEPVQLTDSTAVEQFGIAVSTSADGKALAVGAYRDDENGASPGNVYVYNDDFIGGWTQSQKLTPTDGAAGDYFGNAVSMSADGTRLAVSAVGASTVYVYERAARGGDFTLSQELKASDGTPFDFFGWSVSMSADGTYVVVGAAGGTSGSVYMFQDDGGNWTQTKKLTASDGAAWDLFGCAVSISADGKRVAVGAFRDDDNGASSGSVYVYDDDATNGFTKLAPSNGAAGAYFGNAVSMSDDGKRLVIGAYGSNAGALNSGSVYVYDDDGTNSWSHSLQLTAQDSGLFQFFGNALSMSGDGTHFAVGSSRDKDNGIRAGGVYVFKYNEGTSEWNQSQKLTAEDGEPGDRFGFAVSMSNDGTFVPVGAPWTNDGINEGNVYLYQYQDATNGWAQSDKLSS